MDNSRLVWKDVRTNITKGLIPADIFKRIGIFVVHPNVLKTRPEFVLEIMAYCIPFSVDISETNGIYEYICYSPLFDVVDGTVQQFPSYRFAELMMENKDTGEKYPVLVMAKESEPSNIIT